MELVGSLLDERQRSIMKEHKDNLAPLLLGFSRLGNFPLTEEQRAELEKRCDTDVAVEEADGGFKITLKRDVGERVLEAIKAVTTTTRHQALLYRSALISLVSAAEWFLAQVVRQYFEKYPDAVGTKDKLLSLQDLTSIGSVEDARRFIVDLRVDEIMWGGFEDWLRFLRNSMKLSMGYLDPHVNALNEVFQRRNVMVHNNGIVHSSYTKKVDASLAAKAKIGDQLDVSSDYLSGAIDLVELNFILIASELWKQLDARDDSRGELLISIAFDRLKGNRWVVAEGLSLFTSKDKNITERCQLVGQLNSWQSIKWQDRFNDVKSQVEAADFSAKDEIYQLVKFVLLDDYQGFFSLLPDLMQRGKVSQEMVEDWPIFREVRRAQEFQQFRSDHKELFKTVEFDKTPPASQQAQ